MKGINLNGLRVLNTRPLKQSLGLNQQIIAAGGLAISCPAMEIASPVDDWMPLLPDLGKVQQAIFTSANAVIWSFSLFTKKHMSWPDHIHIIAVGNATALALQSQKVRVDNIPHISDSEHLLMLNALQTVHDETILLVKGNGGRTLIANSLRERGAHVIELNVYQRVLPDINQKKLEQWWRDDCVDIILFTSQEAILNIMTMFGKNAETWLKRTPCLVISERLAQVARQSGIQNIHVCSPETILEALSQFNQGSIYGKD